MAITREFENVLNLGLKQLLTLQIRGKPEEVFPVIRLTNQILEEINWKLEEKLKSLPKP